jgi:hypothetical protein
MGSVSLNDGLVKRGWAVAYREYSKTHVRAEGAAQAAKRGIWSVTFQMPAEWRQERHGQRSSNTSTNRGPRMVARSRTISAVAAGRSITSRVIGITGATRINTRRGGRCFCTEREAQDNGWKHAGE